MIPRRTCRPLFLGALALVSTAVPVIAQSTWLNVSTLRGPSARRDHSMAYDANRGVVVLFGGRRGTVKVDLSDTWEWDGYLWTRKTPTRSPSARSFSAMAYDAKRKKVVLFGGGGLADTWTWDGFAWTQLTPSSTPPSRSQHAMAYDSHREVIVLFGGGSGSTYGSDTWEWNGTTWTERKGVNPGGKGQHGLAYDAERKQTVLFGGKRTGGNPNTETWQWNGSLWNRIVPMTRPNGVVGISMAYDNARRLTIVFGGMSGNPPRFFSDFHEWDGRDWSAGKPKHVPSARVGQAMAYDSKRRRMVVFGGSSSGVGVLGDTWELVNDCLLVGEGHPGGGLPINCLSSPLLGKVFQLAYAATGSGMLFVGSAPVGTPWLQASPPLVCRPGTVYAAPLVSIPGFGAPIILNLAIPNDPRILGTRVTLQGVAAQGTGCFLLTDAVEVEVRNR